MSVLDSRCWILDDKRCFSAEVLAALAAEFRSGDLRFYESGALRNVAQILTVPRGGNALPWRVRARLVRARGNALLAQLAHVPVLLVRHVPELNRVLGFEIFSLE